MCYVIRIYRSTNHPYVTVIFSQRAQTQLSRGAQANPTAAFHDPGAKDPTFDKLKLIRHSITIINVTKLLHNTHFTFQNQLKKMIIVIVNWLWKKM